MARNTSFRFTAVADPATSTAFARHSGAARFAYNQDLRAVMEALTAKKTDPSIEVPWTGFDLINHFNAWKRSAAAGHTWAVDSAGAIELVDTGLGWRGEVCAQVFEEAGIDLGHALNAWSNSRKGNRKGPRVGFPRLKKKSRCRESFRLRNKIRRDGRPTIRVGEKNRPRSLTLPVIGVIRVVEDTRRLRRLLRPGPGGAPLARIWFVTVSKHRGRWTITVTVKAPDFHPNMRHSERAPHHHGGFVGVDRGLIAYTVAATADGEEVGRTSAPRALAGSLRKLRRLNRTASRKELRSKNRKKADERLNRINGRIADQRRHFVHQVTTRLVKTHDRLCVEALAVANMVRNRRLARPIADSAWGELYRQLAYKAAWYGTCLVLAPRYFPSSRRCSTCGHLSETLTLGVRTFRCEPDSGGCGLVMDRDRNAATNLAVWAEAEHCPKAQTSDPQAGGRVTNACGGTSAGRRTRGGGTGPAIPQGKKQERITAVRLPARNDA